MDYVTFNDYLDLTHTIFIGLDIALGLAFIYALLEGWKLRPIGETVTRSKKEVLILRKAVFAERWEKIAKKFDVGTYDAWRLAIIEADALVDGVLKEIGLPGEHMADRLTALDPAEVTTLDRVWHAHKLRNDLVHTSGFSLSERAAREALRNYESFFKELDVI